MTDERETEERRSEQDRARLFDRIHRSPRIPDRYAERRTAPDSATSPVVIPAKAGIHWP